MQTTCSVGDRQPVTKPQQQSTDLGFRLCVCATTIQWQLRIVGYGTQRQFKLCRPNCQSLPLLWEREMCSRASLQMAKIFPSKDTHNLGTQCDTLDCNAASPIGEILAYLLTHHLFHRFTDDPPVSFSELIKKCNECARIKLNETHSMEDNTLYARFKQMKKET